MAMMNGDGWSWVWGGLMMLIFWGGLVALVVFAVRGGFGARSSHGDERRSAPDAQEILAERFARGEISEDEFEERRHVLERRAS
jgi:putative membrane protein